MIRRRASPLLAAVALCSLLTGCWDFRDTNERALALMVGVDRGQQRPYLVSVQVPLAVGGTTDPATRGSFRVLSGEGDTVESALEQVRSALYRYLELGQVKVIVLGPSVGREGLNRLDWLWQTRRVPGVAMVAVSRQSAADAVSAKTPPLAIPALFIHYQFSPTYNRDDSIWAVPRWNAWVKLRSALEDVVLPALTTQRYGLNVDGAGVFRRDRLVGWLEREDVSYLNRLHSGRFDGEVTAQGPGGKNLSARLVGGRHRYGVYIGPNREPVLWAELRAEGILRHGVETTLLEAEAPLNSKMTAGLKRAIARLQALESDPFGFGERLRRLDPTHPAVASSDAWRRAFRTAPVEVTASVRLRSSGYLR